jgi:hypothetical protein
MLLSYQLSLSSRVLRAESNSRNYQNGCPKQHAHNEESSEKHTRRRTLDQLGINIVPTCATKSQTATMSVLETMWFR